ncbi:MAG: ankyrin, partial [Planctomycetota bacterium]
MSKNEVLEACYQALESGDVSEARQRFAEHPELRSNTGVLLSQLDDAAYRGDLPIVKVLVEMGADFNAPRDKHAVMGAIYSAAMGRATNVVAWLLEQGARVNVECDGVIRSPPLISASRDGYLDIAKHLIAHGAVFNAVWGGKTCLSHALECGQQEVADYLRSIGAKLPEELEAPQPADPNRDGLIEHVSWHLGQPQRDVIQEFIPNTPSVAIHVIRNEDEREQILFTVGMSSLPMTVPPGGEAYQYAELVLRLPLDWPLSTKSFDIAEDFWPIEWLRRVAFYPYQNQTWLGGPYTIIANGEPPEPFAPNTKMSCLMLLANPSEFGRWTRPTDGAEVVFYDLFGLYTEERDLELREGLPELLNRFQSRFISKVLDPQR